MGENTAKVLLADDAPEVAKRVAEMLSDLPVEIVAIAQDGEEALELFKQTEPEVAIIDFQMPKMNGIHVVSCLRGHGSAALLILLTNLDSPEFFQRATQAGADHFLSKRTQFLELRNIVENFLKSRI